MEYTNDIILNVRLKKDKPVFLRKFRMFKKIIEVNKCDEYFVLTIMVSIVVIFIDFLLLKQFMDIFKLL